jgi:hypothetical protein
MSKNIGRGLRDPFRQIHERLFGMTGWGHEGRIQALEKAPLPAPPTGILEGVPSVDVAITQPGTLLWRYKCNDASGQLTDTAAWDATARNLLYLDDGTLGGGLYHFGTSAPGWTSANEATFGLLDHPEFGTADDGCIKFNYQQDSFDPDSSKPGVFFQGGGWSPGLLDMSAGAAGARLQTVGCFIKAATGPRSINGHVFGNTLVNSSAINLGWSLLLNQQTRVPVFVGGNSVDGNFLLVTSPYALIAGKWIFVCVTWDGALYTMWFDGVPVVTGASTKAPSGGGSMRVGGSFYASGFTDGAFSFIPGGTEVDEILGYGSVLTPGEMAAIAQAKDVGSQTTTVGVTLGAGSAGVPNALTSQLPDGSNAPSDYVFAADGSGGSQLARPKLKFYLNGG